MKLSLVSSPLVYSVVGALALGHVGPWLPVLQHARVQPVAVPALEGMRDSVQLSTITTDTGAFATGYSNFSRFLAPGMCIAAVRNATRVFHRSLAVQRAASRSQFAMTSAEDSLPQAAIAIARTCVARFTTANISNDGDLADLFALELMAGRDKEANAIMEHRLAAASTAARRDSVRQQTIDAYLAVSPARVTAAQALAAQIDALGPEEGVAQLYAHWSLLRHARSHFEVSRIQAEAETIITLGKTADMKVIQFFDMPIIEAYSKLGEVAYVEAPDSVLAIMTRAKKDLARFPTCNQFPPGMNFEMIQCVKFDNYSAEDTRDLLLPFNSQQYAQVPPPAVVTSSWFPKAPEAWPPGHGHPSLILYRGPSVAERMRTDDDIFRPIDPDPVARKLISPLYIILPLWIGQYGDRLSITVISGVRGSAVRSPVLSPMAEADSIDWFFREHLKLPVTVGVVTAFRERQRPASDGAWDKQDTTVLGRFFANAGPKINTGGGLGTVGGGTVFGETGIKNPALLFDANGKLAYVGEFDAPFLNALIARMMKGSTNLLNLNK